MVGPDYVPPKSELPANFTGQTQPRAGGRSLDDDWWRKFGDPELDTLVSEALVDNPDLAVASARVQQARAERAAVATEEDPDLSVGSSFRRQHGSANVPVGTPPGGLGHNVGSNLWLAGFDAGWEIDLFGGTRRAVESADATVAATIADRREAELVLVAEIVRDYIDVRAQQRRVAIAREILAVRRDALKLVTAQFNGGLAGALDPIRAQAELDDSQAEIPEIETAEMAAIYRLGALVGKPPEDIAPSLLLPRPIPDGEIDIPSVLPSDLLQRRPDIRAAERRIEAANARIGMREADLFPHFSLTGAAGFESLDAGDFLDGGSRYFAVGPSLTWLVFDSGRVHDEVLVETARTNAAAADYQRTVLTALGEVETALVSYGHDRVERDARSHEVEAARQALTLAQRLYAQGLEDFLTVLDAERTLQASEMNLATAEQGCADSLVALVKALGGGWTDSKG